MTIESAVELYNSLEADYAKIHGKRFFATMEYMQKFGITSGCVLDIGGGGEAMMLFQACCEKATFIATNFDLRENFPFFTDTFDGATCCEVIEHITDKDYFDQLTFTGLFGFFSEIFRVLKSDARVVFTTPNLCSYAALYSIFNGGHPFNYASHSREYALYELVNALQYVGFEILHAGSEHIWLNGDVIMQMDALMDQIGASKENRGDDLFIVCRKPCSGEGKCPTAQEAGKILSPQLKQYQGKVVTN